jgi:hypothetical protein
MQVDVLDCCASDVPTDDRVGDMSIRLMHELQRDVALVDRDGQDFDHVTIRERPAPPHERNGGR